LSSLPRRHQDVLRATVRHYVDTVEPVGSHTLVRRFGFDASPATVRSAMGALEQRGLLTQPHTSAGRIPSQLGYRLYVDELLPAPGAAAQQLERELMAMSLHWAALDDLLLQLCRRLADLTGLLGLITRPQRPRPGLQAVRLVPSGERLLVFLVRSPSLTTSLNLRLSGLDADELPILERWVNGQLPAARIGEPLAWHRLPRQLQRSGDLLRQSLDSHERLEEQLRGEAVAAGLGGLLGQPEFSRSSSLLPLVRLVEQGAQQVFGPGPSLVGERVWIGSEHPLPELASCAVVQASYSSGDGGTGHVALVGPMRMAYATARAAVQSVAEILQRLLG
jgi:heat-inducible transcriptional repressor